VKTPAVDEAAVASEGAADDVCEPDRSNTCWTVRRGGALRRGVGVEKDILGDSAKVRMEVAGEGRGQS
jgi:hypothetical protein